MDKILHFLAGYFICSVLAVLLPASIGLVCACLAGIIKEIYDEKIRMTFFSIPDMLFTFAGGLTAFIIAL